MTHERWGANDEPTKNGQLCYPDDIDRPLREAAQKKVLKYQNANDHSITFEPAIASTTGRLHAEFLRLLFWHAHCNSEELFKLTTWLLFFVVPLSTFEYGMCAIWYQPSCCLFSFSFLFLFFLFLSFLSYLQRIVLPRGAQLSLLTPSRGCSTAPLERGRRRKERLKGAGPRSGHPFRFWPKFNLHEKAGHE